MYTPQWLWAIPGVVLLPFFLWRARKWVWIPLLGLLWVAGPMMGYSWGGSADPGSKVPIKVMTWNIQWWRSASVSSVAAEILREDPDILCLQDARGVVEGGIKEPLKGYKVAAFGQYVIASKLKITNSTVGDISYRGERHTYLRAVIDANGRSITVCTAHFTTPRDGLSGIRHFSRASIGSIERNLQDRLIQAEAISRDVRKIHGSVIVTGDLNAPIQSLACRKLLNLGLRDSFGLAGRGYGYTYGHTMRFGRSFVRIDHILASEDLRPVRCEVGQTTVSDHRPVIAEFLPSE